MGISRTASLIATCLLALAACSREPQDWTAAQQADTAASYQQFLQQHPNSSKAPQAQARIKQLAEEHDWQVAAAADTRDAYQQFLTAHPDSKYAQEARIRIENFAQTAAANPITPGVAAGAGAASGTTPAGALAAGAGSVGGAGVAPAPAPAQAAPAPRSGPASRGTTGSRGAKSAARRSSANSSGQARRSSAAGHSAAAHARYAQVGAFSSRARAESQWKQLQRRFPAALRGLAPHYAASRRAGHTIYRLQVATSSAAAAQRLCRSLKRHAQSCVVVSG